MNTPCQEAPEAWVGNDDKLRAEAANDCRTKCPVFAECLAGAFGKPGPDDHGVWAGTDYVNGKPVVVTQACANCGIQVGRSDAKFCSRECYWASMVAEGEPREKTCPVCESEFRRGEKSSKQWRAARFCSNACAGKSRRKVAA